MTIATDNAKCVQLQVSCAPMCVRKLPAQRNLLLSAMLLLRNTDNNKDSQF